MHVKEGVFDFRARVGFVLVWGFQGSGVKDSLLCAWVFRPFTEPLLPQECYSSCASKEIERGAS